MELHLRIVQTRKLSDVCHKYFINLFMCRILERFLFVIELNEGFEGHKNQTMWLSDNFHIIIAHKFQFKE